MAFLCVALGIMTSSDSLSVHALKRGNEGCESIESTLFAFQLETSLENSQNIHGVGHGSAKKSQGDKGPPEQRLRTGSPGTIIRVLYREETVKLWGPTRVWNR